MAKKKEENQPSLFDNLALEYNLESTHNKPLTLEKALSDANLMEEIKEHILSFDEAYPVVNILKLSFASFTQMHYGINEFLELQVSHNSFTLNPLKRIIWANENFNIEAKLYDRKNKIKIASFKIPYENPFNKEVLTEEELKETSLNQKDLDDKLKALPQHFYNYLHQDEILKEKLKSQIRSKLSELLDEDNHVIKDDLNLFGGYQLNLLDWENVGKNKISLELMDCNKQRIFISTFNKSLSKNKILATIEQEIQRSIQGENDETRTINATSKSEVGGELQQASKPQSLSMGYTQPSSLNDSKESLPEEVSTKQGGERLNENEAGGDERGSEETSSFRDENYRLSNEAEHRERKGAYYQGCEILARNSLSDDENLAKNSQSLLKTAELIKDYEKALLELYLAGKTQKELEFFHKIKSLYENLSDKFRQRDTHTKLEDKYQSQKDTLTPAQKDKMSEDFILALSTNTKMSLSEETSSFIASNLYEKAQSLKANNQTLEESLKKIEEIGLEFKDLKNTQHKIRKR